MLNKGPIPAAVHGIIEYLAGVLLIAAPYVFDFEATRATTLSVGVGVVILVVAAVSKGPTGLIDELPVSAHVVLDLVLAVFLIAASFLFGFSEDGKATAFFIALGVVHLLITIATRFVRTDAAAT
ncbi:MAG: hypothetical protein M3N28_03125 [Actinomycetota bacterium]|nr:hypothetical protein [Actinomycetota bacterium]